MCPYKPGFFCEATPQLREESHCVGCPVLKSTLNSTLNFFPSTLNFFSKVEGYLEGCRGCYSLSSTVKRNGKRLRIYALLAEGRCKARVAELLGIPEATVSYHAGILEREKYLRRIKGLKNPVLYEKGPKGTILDTAIHDLNLQLNATGVTSPSKKTADVPTAKVHHGKVKMNVLKIGDFDEIRVRENGRSYTRPFLSKYFDYRILYPSLPLEVLRLPQCRAVQGTDPIP